MLSYASQNNEILPSQNSKNALNAYLHTILLKSVFFLLLI